MGETDTMNDNDKNADDRALLENLDRDGHGLTPWELDFVESITRKLNAGHALSEKQRAKMLSIIEERT